MKKGYLKYNESTRRFHFWLADPRGYWYPDIPLHCGDCFDVKIDGVWRSTRIEAGGGSEPEAYYLVGTNLHGLQLEDIEARM